MFREGRIPFRGVAEIRVELYSWLREMHCNFRVFTEISHDFRVGWFSWGDRCRLLVDLGLVNLGTD
jgi:hypothetical protein